MEDLLTVLMKDAQAAKFTPVRHSCQNALDILKNKEQVEKLPAYALRERCLEPLQLAFESRVKRLMNHAVSGIEKLLKDERLQSTLETEHEDKWLPIQVLKSVYSTPNLPEDIQVDVMKLLLKMTFSTAWCLNSHILTHIAEGHGKDVLSDFNAKGNSDVESVTSDIVKLLQFLIDRITAAQKAGQNKHVIPLLLEGVLAVLTNSSQELRKSEGFQQLVWTSLCPTLISLLGLPKTEEKPKTSSGLNLDNPALPPHTAKTIYSISVCIAKMVGPMRSLRPVLESLFHRILICSAPVHRLDALKAVKQLFNDADSLCNLTVTFEDNTGSNSKCGTQQNDIAFLKMIVDSIHECSHTTDSNLCYLSVKCIDDLLASVEQIDQGTGIHGDMVKVIQDKYKVSKDKSRRPSDRSSSLSSQQDKDDMGPSSSIANVKSTMNQSDPVNGYDQALSKNEETDSAANEQTQSTNQLTATTANDQAESTNDLAEITANDISENTLMNGPAIHCTSAQDFMAALSELVVHLLTLSIPEDVDEAIQTFSSDHSERVSNSDPTKEGQNTHSYVSLLNADSIYSTTYTVLCLTLKLSVNGFYETGDKTAIPMSEKSFIDTILDTDMFLYLSPDWLSQVYKCVLQTDILRQAGWTEDEDIPFIVMLKDIDGPPDHIQGGAVMANHLEDESEESDDRKHVVRHPENIEAGKLLAKEILSTCWQGILDILSVMLNGKSVCGVTNAFAIMIGTDAAKDEYAKKREALLQCLNGLRKAAKLCCSLGLQERCAAVFELLANTSCVIEDFKHATQVPVDRNVQKSQPKTKLAKLHAAHVLSMDALMTTGLEIGSHSDKCWKHVFRCCAFISELEHTYFSHGNNQTSLPRIQQEHTKDVTTNDIDTDELYSVPMTPVVPVAPRINVTNLIKQSGIESGWDSSISGGGVLNSAQASQALCGLSQEVDKLFEDAANNLNMRALCEFLGDLCESSKHQLYKISKRYLEDEDGIEEYHRLPVNSLHLYRLQNVLMKIAHSYRPLLHLIKAWSVVSSYLVECAGHKDRSVSKLAVTCVHDYILAVLTSHVEMAHFHTNEMLCKTFENILCLELCDGDVQDQIVCSICELVETSASDIRSGWRPLFGALRAVRIEYTTIEEVNEARQRHVEAVLDVFDVYLNTDNILVFANATVDCILCLLKYVRGPGEFEDSDSDDDDSVNDYMVSSPASENLCLPALQYLKQCSIILQSMWKMPACPVFHGAKRIQVDTTSRCVDPNIPNMNFKKFARYFHTVNDAGDASTEIYTGSNGPKDHNEFKIHAVDQDVLDDSESESCDSLQQDDCMINDQHTNDVESPKVDLVTLVDLDNHTGILHVWFLMLEGLSGALSGCPKSYQPDSMEALFELLRTASHVPGPKFGLYCVNHLLLPMLQSWLRCGSKKYGYWETGATNFKQCCGQTTDLIVDLVHDFKGNREIEPFIQNVLEKLLIVLTECVAQPFEVISRLGCSCIRHVLLSASNDFTEVMWQTVIDGLQNALDVTTYCLRQIMVLFKEHSENFYGDVGQLKVATRRDCSPQEFVRMWHLAQQVFLLDSQVTVDIPHVENQEEKSYVLLLYPPGYENSLNPDHILARVPFRSIVVGLLSHQLLLQTIGCILLEGKDSVPCQMPGRLSQLSTNHVKQLMGCLRNSYKLACDFDLRPGLKFLLQKVAHTPVAVNLYKQAGASMVFYIHTLIKICSNIPDLCVEKVKALLQKENKKDTKSEGKQEGKGIGSHSGKSADLPKEMDSDETYINKGKNSDSDKGNVENTSTGALKEKDTDTVKSSTAKLDDNTEKSASATKDDTKTETKVKEIPALITACTKVVDHPDLYLSQLLSVCDELCQTYIDILYDKAGTSCVDTMSDQQLFFLIAQPDDMPEVGKKVDFAKLNKDLETTRARFQGTNVTVAVSVQGDEMQEESPAITRTETEPVLPPISPAHAKSKKEIRSEQESRVYNLATDKLIKNLMLEYKKKKNQNAMPTFSKPKKEKKDKKAKKQLSDPVEEMIDQQQQTSIMKDSEAHLQSWTELLCSILGLFHQLNDNQFRALLPVVYGCVNHLVCHAQDMRLRERLAEMLHRIGDLFCLTLDS